jgi:hypothetical protein
VFTPYATHRVVVKGLDGVMDHDVPKAEGAAGLS